MSKVPIIGKSEIVTGTPKLEIKEPLESLVLIRTPEEEKQYLRKLLEKQLEPGFWEKLWFVVKTLPKAIYIIYLFVQLIQGFKSMNKDKTTNYVATITLILTILWGILNLFGVEIPEEMKQTIADGAVYIVGFVITVIAWFTGKNDDGTAKTA